MTLCLFFWWKSSGKDLVVDRASSQNPNPGQRCCCLSNSDLWPPWRAVQMVSPQALKNFPFVQITIINSTIEDFTAKICEWKQCTWQQLFLVKLQLIGLHAAFSTGRPACRLSACQPARLVAAVVQPSTAIKTHRRAAGATHTHTHTHTQSYSYREDG